MIWLLLVSYAVIGVAAAIAFENTAPPDHTRMAVIKGAVVMGLLWPLAALFRLGYLIGEW